MAVTDGNLACGETGAAGRVPDAAAGQPAADSSTPQPRTPKAEKELLCTICNLRACWEAPAAPDAAARTP